MSAVGVPPGWKWPLGKPVLGCMTMATASVPPAEFEMASILRVVEKFFLTLDRLSEFLWSVAVVMTDIADVDGEVLKNVVHKGNHVRSYESIQPGGIGIPEYELVAWRSGGNPPGCKAAQCPLPISILAQARLTPAV